MKLFEINKPRVRMSPDGRMVPAPSSDTIPWQRPAMPRKRKPKQQPMQAVAQAQPYQHNLSPKDKAAQQATKDRMKANRGGAPMNPSMATGGLKQQTSLTNRMATAARTPSANGASGGGFPDMVKRMATGNPQAIDQILQALNKALVQNGQGRQNDNQMLGYRRTSRIGGDRLRGRPRVMNRQQADQYLRSKGIQVESLDEALNNTSLPLEQITTQAMKMQRVELIGLIKYIEAIKKEGTKPGQKPTGNYRNRPSALGVNRNDALKTPAPTQANGGPKKQSFGGWLTGNR